MQLNPFLLEIRASLQKTLNSNSSPWTFYHIYHETIVTWTNTHTNTHENISTLYESNLPWFSRYLCTIFSLKYPLIWRLISSVMWIFRHKVYTGCEVVRNYLLDDSILVEALSWLWRMQTSYSRPYQRRLLIISMYLNARE